MLRLNQKIIINRKELPHAGEITITTSRNTFTDTARVTLPNLANKKGVKISSLIPLGSPITIMLGYFPNLSVEFSGYVSQIVPDKTCTIYCENEAYIAKRTPITEDLILKNTTLPALIGAVYKGAFVASNVNIGDWKIAKNTSVLDVLKELQDKYKIYSYWRNKGLVVGADVDPIEPNTIPCNFQGNVPIGESSFNFKDASADKIVVKASAINREGILQEIYAYYEGTPAQIIYSAVAPPYGNINEFNIGGQGEVNTSTLRDLARIRLEALSFTGCDGSIVIYGEPQATHGDFAVVKDLRVLEKNDTFAIVEVVKTFGSGGFRQELKLGIKL